mmetsp:Transcript_26942/g.52518  ORF Transcript_26942/g.52518 Transcript_26942/m.52518 type:complete len:551 (+) Transcript_26942:225-1877(+)
MSLSSVEKLWKAASRQLSSGNAKAASEMWGNILCKLKVLHERATNRVDVTTSDEDDTEDEADENERTWDRQERLDHITSMLQDCFVCAARTDEQLGDTVEAIIKMQQAITFDDITKPTTAYCSRLQLLADLIEANQVHMSPEHGLSTCNVLELVYTNQIQAQTSLDGPKMKGVSPKIAALYSRRAFALRHVTGQEQLVLRDLEASYAIYSRCKPPMPLMATRTLVLTADILSSPEMGSSEANVSLASARYESAMLSLTKLDARAHALEIAEIADSLTNLYKNASKTTEALRTSRQAVQLRQKMRDSNPSQWSDAHEVVLNRTKNICAELQRLDAAARVAVEKKSHSPTESTPLVPVDNQEDLFTPPAPFSTPSPPQKPDKRRTAEAHEDLNPVAGPGGGGGTAATDRSPRDLLPIFNQAAQAASSSSMPPDAEATSSNAINRSRNRVSTEVPSSSSMPQQASHTASPAAIVSPEKKKAKKSSKANVAASSAPKVSAVTETFEGGKNKASGASSSKAAGKGKAKKTSSSQAPPRVSERGGCTTRISLSQEK